MLGNLLKKYSSTMLKAPGKLGQNNADLFKTQNDFELGDFDLDGLTNHLLSPDAQARRKQVLSMLNVDPLFNRALIDDHDCDPRNVILTLAIRHIGTVELLLSKASFNGLTILNSLESLQTTH